MSYPFVSAVGYLSSSGTGLSAFEKDWAELNLARNIAECDPQNYLGIKGNKNLSRASRIYCNVAYQCIESRDLAQVINIDSSRVGLYCCSDLCLLDDLFEIDISAKITGPQLVSPIKAPRISMNVLPGTMAIKGKIQGPNVTVAAGSNGGLQSLDVCMLHLEMGLIDYGIVVSVETNSIYHEMLRDALKIAPVEDYYEYGIALVIEKANKNTNSCIRIVALSSVFQLKNESVYVLLARALEKVEIDLLKGVSKIIITGNGVVDKSLENFFRETIHKEVTFLYPEDKFGIADTSAGLLSLLYLYSNSNFNQQVSMAKSNELNMICSIDVSGNCSVAIVTV
jgi:3-oxoacyl-[acyl-carrier-protein] synthase II